MAGLPEAISQIINSDGSTLLLDQQERIAELAATAAEKRDDLLEQEREILADQEAAFDLQIDLESQAIDLQKKALQVIEKLSKETERSLGKIGEIEATIGRLNTDLERIRRLAKK